MIKGQRTEGRGQKAEKCLVGRLLRRSLCSLLAMTVMVLLITIHLTLYTVFAAPPYDGGTGDGWGLSASADTSLGGARINFSSQATQIFFLGDAPTAISSITISQEAASGIAVLKDIRIRIPSSLAMSWDTTDTAAAITDTASSKVSSTVSYPDSKTLLIDVTADFLSGDAIVISGLAFNNFTAASTGKLSLNIFNSGINEYLDIQDKSIGILYTFGDGWAYAASRSRCLTPPAITAPAGGERWVVDSVQPITWSTSGFSGTTLKLQYSKDDFSSNIVNITGASALTASAGTFNWTIPDDIYPAVKVRFVDNNNPDVTGSSAGFKIIGAFDLTSPDGGENWIGGSAHNITWTTTGTISTIKLAYSADNFALDIHTIGTPPILNTGSYSWSLPTIAASAVKVRVSDNADSTVYNTSAANFTITSLQITSPNSGETWEAGTAHNITWTSVGTVSNQLTIEYSKDDFATPILIADQQANDGMYSWTVPNDVSNSVKIRIRDIVSPFATDTSDVNFRVQPAPQITVSVPNGGESWQVGSQHNITWTANAAVSNNLKFEYSKDDFAGDIHEINNFQVVLPGWNYSIPVTINNSTNTNNLTDYQVRISIDSTLSSFWNHVKSDGSDIRFYDYNPTTVLAYYLGAFDYANKSAVIYVKLPLIPASSSKIINLCYGNPSAVSLSNFDNVFPTGYSETGLAGLWHFSEGKGTTVADASGNNNNGTWSGTGVHWNTSGKYGSAGISNGINDYVNAGNAANLNIQGSLTVEAWVNPTLQSNVCCPSVVVKQVYTSSSINAGFHLRVTDSGQVLFTLENNGAGTAETTGITANQWWHIVGTYDNSRIRLYVNGVLRDERDWGKGIGNHSGVSLKIGGADWAFSGSVDEVGIYNRALSEEEIQAHYRKQKTASPEPTVSLGAEKGNVLSTPTLPYAKVITISNTGAALSDYQFKITLDSADTSFWSHVKSDGGDIRFYDDSTELAYWVESFNYAGKSAIVWVKLPSVPALSTKKIYLYFGNSSLTTLSNYDNVFTKDYSESGLAGLWHMDAGAGNTVVDASGNANSGTYNGRVGLSFDGSNDYVSVANSASLDITNNQISIEAWIYPKDLVESYILSKYPGDTTASGYNFLITSASIYFRLGDGAVRQQFAVAHGMAINNWYHVVAVYDGTNMYIYKNGVALPGSTAFTGNIGSNTYGVRIGVTSDNWYPFNGNMDGVRIYNRALSAAEVTAHYNGTYSNETGLVGNWQMNDGGTSQAVADSSGSGNNGNRGATSAVEGTDPAWFTASPAWQAQDGGQWGSRSDVKFSSGSALSFDGVSDYLDCGNAASLDITNDITMETWVKLSVNNRRQRLIVKTNEPWTSGFTLTAWETGKFYAIYYIDGAWRWSTDSASFSTNTWYHVVSTYSSATKQINLYVNGTAVTPVNLTGLNTYSITAGAANKLEISTNTSEAVNGTIDEVRIYNRALSAGEIQAQYQRSKYAATAPAYSVGLEQANTVTTANFLYNKLVTIDNSGNANALTDYQVKVTLNNSQEFFWSHVKYDGSDIRLYDGGTELSHWFETFDYANKSAAIWVKVLSIPASASKTLKLCYGNFSVASASSFDSVFTKDYADSGLAGAWHFDEGSGSSVADVSGNNNTGTLTNGTVWQGDAKFNSGSSLRFDGVNDYVDAGNGASLNITDAITISLWIKTGTNVIEWPIILGKGSTSYNIQLYNPTQRFGFWGNIGGVSIDNSNGPIIPLNVWSHIVVRYDGSKIDYFLNTVSEGGIPASGSIALNANSFMIGNTNDRAYFFNGSIDDVRIYNRALSAGEIQALYQRRKYTYPEPAASVEGDNIANGSVYLWNIPDDVSSTVKVRITDNNRPTCTDKSDNYFSITQPSITVTSPNGGEVWVNGDTRNITWTTSGQVSDKLKLEYSKDNFASDVHLISSIWPYYQTITIDNIGNTKALYDYQVKITYNNAATSFWSGVHPDGSDIRFFDGANGLSYWIETFDYTNKNAALWVKVPSVPASSLKIITLKSGASGGGSNFSNTFTKNPEGVISFSGLVGNWLMNESSGTTTADSSGSANTGTLYGPARPTGLSFDGVNDYVDCGNGASLDITGDLTIEAWVKPNSVSSGTTRTIVGRKPLDSTLYGYRFALRGDYYEVQVSNGSDLGNGGKGTSISTVQANVWQHVTVTFSSGQWKYYYNGVLFDSDTVTTTTILPGSEKVAIGSRSATNNGYGFDGAIDEVRIYNRALTAGEITNNYNGQVVRDASLVMEQRMGEGSGTTLNDNSGNNNNGTISGATWVASDRKLAKGHIGNYLEFDGKDDYVDAGNAASLNITNAITVSAWVNILNTSANQRIIGKSNVWLTGWSSIAYDIGMSSGFVRWRIGNGTNQDPGVNEVTYPAVAGWQHIVATYDGSTTSIYKNGVLQQSKAISITILSTANPLKISDTSGSFPFNGSIDEVKIYNRALSAAEISEQYEIGRGLVGAWNFDEAGGTTVADSSGQGNTGTLVNGPTWDSVDGGQWGARSDVKFNSGSALSFDGVNDYVDCGNTSSLNLQSQSITIEGWFYSSDWNGQADWASPVEKVYQGGSPEQRKGYGYWIWNDKTVNFMLFRSDGVSWGSIQQSFGIPSNDTWNHLVGVYNYSSGMMYAYKNGVLVNSANVGVYNWNAGTEVPLNIGRRTNAYRYFNGKIDEVRIYNRALTAGEILAHYQRRKPTLPEPAISSLAVASQDGLLSNSYPWVIPNDPSATVKVRITDNARPAVTDTSDNNFQILGHSSITLTSPNGNESLIMGDSHNITWVSYGAGVSNDLKLEYSLNSGTTWALIADQQANDGTYTWSVPNIETVQGLVRITDNIDATITDTSDAEFAIIQPTISITSPNGGESWYATGAFNITWSSVGSVSNNLKLEYTLNGTTWTQIATALANSGTYAWTVPDSASLTCKVRITDNTRVTVTDTSNTDFSIAAPTITLTSPNGAEEWVVGTAHDITWTSVGTNNSIKNNLTLQYSKDNFATNMSISTAQANDGVFTWTIPDDVSATVKVKIFDASRPATVDTSNANFSITQPYVRITAPNGGESWVIGTAHNITWTSLGAISNNLTIEYSKDNFATAAAISAAEANDGTYAWTVPDDVSSTAKVRVTDADRPAVTDRSDGSFVIANSILTVTRPNGAELFTDGDSENITWTSTGTVSNNLKLDYSKDNFATAGILIATGLSNSGTYPWTVPSDISATVRVRITDTVRPAVWDKSNASFTILPVPQLTIVSPNGGETWRVGSIYTISWSDNGGVVSNNLTVQYSVDGANWIGISTGEANDGSYSWTIPDNVSVSASVRVYDASRPGNSDVSDLAFSIALPLINITSPNGGETYAVGDAPVITWTTEGAVSENLTLEYTTDGANFNLIAPAQANTGSYAWTIPDFVSTSVKIRITDGNRPTVSGLSNANFTVIQYPTVTVTAPNGGEVYTIGDTLPITWSYKGLNINPLTISYSLDNFVTGSVIATGVAHATRSYNWAIPDNALAANTLKVKIYDPLRSVISDISDAVFRIKGGFVITAPVANARFIAKKPETISWSTKGTVANVKLEYSTDSGTTWNLISSSAANTGSYIWTTVDNRTANYTVQVRVSDITDSTINAVSGLFKIDYYTISWRVLDYDTNAPLQLLSVKDTFWADQTNTLTSPLDHDYPYGAYTTFWSKEGYIERAMEWTADGDKLITVTLENQITAAVEWHVLLSSSYSADTDILKVSTWLERRGKLVGTTATDLADLQSAIVEIFDGTASLKSMTVNTHDSQGVFWFSWDQTGLTAGKTYFVRSSITYRSSTYTSGSAVDVTAAKKQLEDKIQMQAIQTQVNTTRVAVDTGTAEIKSKLDDTKASVETKVAEVKGETSKILAAAEVALPAKIEEARAEVETTRKSEILNRENTVRTGQALNIRFRTYSGLSPVLDVYNKDNLLKIDKAKMKEVGVTGIYEYEVKFVSNWGKGDYTIVCSETTKGTMDALIVTVLSTDVEEISGQVSAVLGTTSGLSDVKALAESLNSQFNIIETSLSKVGADLAKEVKDAIGSVSSLESIYTQLSNVAKEVKNISGEAGINLQKLYEISSDKKQDINYLKNKTQQLKAAMALNQKTVDNIANKPVTQTWYEYR